MLGLSGGLAPGPLTALVVRQSLTWGRTEGLKVALVPVLTDGPLLLVAAWLATRARDLELFYAGISAVGALFLVYLAWETARVREVSVQPEAAAEAGSVWRGVLTNVLNPHPYVFWGAVGGPLLAAAWEVGVAATVTFTGVFFAGLCGSKAALAWLVGTYRQGFHGAPYRWTMRLLAVFLLVMAGLFAADALRRVL